jgi:hypothetical protein
LKNGRIATVTGKNGLPCDAVQWTITDAAQSVWLMMPCGLVRVARSELDAWTIASMVSGEPLPCSPEVEEELLRIAQEASSNANRHAQAKEIRIAPLIQRDSA